MIVFGIKITKLNLIQIDEVMNIINCFLFHIKASFPTSSSSPPTTSFTIETPTSTSTNPTTIPTIETSTTTRTNPTTTPGRKLKKMLPH